MIPKNTSKKGLTDSIPLSRFDTGASSIRSPARSIAMDSELKIQYRTLSMQIDNKQVPAPTTKKDPALAIREIKVHLNKPEDVFTRFSTTPCLGLENSAVQRKMKDGKNKISSPPKQYWKSALNYIFGGFNALMWIAFLVTILSYKPLGGDPAPIFNLGVAILLLLVIFVSATFYAFVDWNASRIMKSIRNLIAEEATVLRDGVKKDINAEDVVVGDIVHLRLGQRVPADLRLIEVSSDVKFDRSLLTGESEPIPGSVEPTDTNPLETRNLALSSTFVVQGTASGVVFAIGDDTVMGRILNMSTQTKTKMTTIQKELWFFTLIISSLAIFLFCLSMLVWGVWISKSYPNFETASTAVVNAIGCLTAFVPQGLPVCVALSLTIIARRMANRNVLVKNLATIETLGCMSVLCSDKTGTLTLGKMTVRNYGFLDRSYSTQKELAATEQNDQMPFAELADVPAAMELQMISRICNAASFDPTTLNLPVSERMINGDATDTAIFRFAESFSGISNILDRYSKIFEIPFNSKNKWMCTIVRDKKTNEYLLLLKGAPDILFKYCTHVLNSNGDAVEFNETQRNLIIEKQSDWSSKGQRVIALCRCHLDSSMSLPLESRNEFEKLVYRELKDLTLVGLLGIVDPPRSDVKDAVQVMRRAGVRVFMVTGDFKLTAVSIAKQVGIVTNEKVDTIDDLKLNVQAYQQYATCDLCLVKPDSDAPHRSLALVGNDIKDMTEEEMNVAVGYYTEIVFARTTPEQKLQIVEAIKKRGDNTVAVTGDGVNDAPALKAADIGIAMGAGSDVAKEAAAMVLLNNDFASIPFAIENGRLVFDNLKKVILYLMPAGTYTEFMAVLGNVFFGMQIALSSYLQVCFSIGNDVIMSIALMYETSESDLMLRKPRNARTDRLTDWRFFIQIYLFIGLMMWPCAMGMYFLHMSQQGLGFYDIVFAYDQWGEGYKGYTLAELTAFVSVGQCIYYVTMMGLQMGNILAIRNRRVSILQSNPFWGPRRNLFIFVGMVGTITISIINLYGPALQNVFGTAPIPAQYWFIPLAFGLGILVMDELRKLLVRTYPKSWIAHAAW